MHPINTVKGEYVKEMINRGTRDGLRDFYQYRSIKVKKNAVNNAEGSAQVDLGNTKVLAGVKLDVETPMPDKPKEGNLMVSAELLPLASSDYDPGPPSPEAVELARVVDRGIRAANVVDMASLFIEEEKVWSIFIDVYVLNYDGNLFDASTLAAMSALSSTRMPKYENEEVIRTGDLGSLKISNTVTSCTYAKFGDKIVLDPMGSEEAAADARLTIANDEKYIRAMQKGLGGGFTPKEVDHLIDKSFEKSKELRDIISNSKGD